MVHPQLEDCVQSWLPYFKKNIVERRGSVMGDYSYWRHRNPSIGEEIEKICLVTLDRRQK